VHSINCTRMKKMVVINTITFSRHRYRVINIIPTHRVIYIILVDSITLNCCQDIGLLQK